MKKLIKIRLVQFFLYETLDIDIGMTCGIFGANGSGKSSLLDAVQIVMLGANEGSGNAGIAFNAQADETNHNSRSIRAYCLGQYGHAPDARVRDSADTYITLLWEDSQTQERISTGIHIHADAAQSYVQGRYIFSGELTLDDHLDKSDGATRPKSWLHFKQMLIQRAPGEETLYDNAKRFVEALLFRLRGASGVPRLDAYRQAFRFGLRMKFDKSVDDIVRRQVLEARPTHIQKFRQVLNTFQEMAALVREVQTKLAEARDIEADFASAQRYQRQAVALHVLAEEAACTAAEAAYAAAVSAEESAATALNIARERQQNIATALQSADEAARRSAEARDRHASHGDRAVLEDALVATRARLASDSARLARALGAIASAIDIQIPGKLLASDDSSAAYRALQTLLGESQWTDETVIAVAHQALRAAKALHNEIFKEMQAAGSALTKAEREYNAAKEAQQRAALGKSPLAPNVLILQRELADANIEAIPVCDVVRIDDPDWQPIIESFLGATNIQALLVQETDERRAFQIARQSRTYDSKIVRASKYAHRASPPAGSVAELIRGDNEAAVHYLRAKLGDFRRAASEDECFKHRFAMTQDGMLLADGEIMRKKTIHPTDFKIGPVTADTRAAAAAQVSERQRALDACQRHYDKLNALYNQIAPFAGNAEDRIADIRDNCAQITTGKSREAAQSERLQALDTAEYRQLVQAAEDAAARVSGLHAEHNQAAQAVGAAENAWQQKCADAQNKADELAIQQEKAAAAREDADFDADTAAAERERLRRQEIPQHEIGDYCRSGSQRARDNTQKKAAQALQKLAAFLVRHNESRAADEQEDWRAARVWLRARITELDETQLHQYRERMEQALNTAKTTFRNDVAVALYENLEWMRNTLNRMNEALRLAPLFTNNERYQFRAQERPETAALLKFIKDVARYGPEEDLFGAAGEMPSVFDALMNEKTAAGMGAVKNALDDYREFYHFDIEIRREDRSHDDNRRVEWLSKRIDSGSGGERRAPLYVIAGAALASAYRLERGDDSGLRLLVIDEAFIKMDLGNIVATMRYFEALGLQVLMASTGDALGILTAFLDRYYDILRDAEKNGIVLDGHDVSAETREQLRADLPEFHPELLAAEISRQAGEGSAP